MQNDSKANFTILTIPRGFKRDGEIDETSIRQLNAIKSWLALTPKPEIILFGDDPGVAETAAELGIRNIPNIEKTESGTPLFSDAILKGQECASADIVVYVNSDILLFDDFTRAIDKCLEKHWSRYLLVGQRLNLDFEEIGAIDFSDSGWQDDLKAIALTYGALAGSTAMDYFVFPKGMHKDMPRFVAGRPAFDSWMTGHAIFDGIPVVDLTGDVLIIHKNHDYRHVIGSKNASNYLNMLAQPEVKRNIELGGQSSAFGLTTCSSWLLKDGALHRRLPTKKTLKNFFRSVISRNFDYMIYEMELINNIEYVKNCSSISDTLMTHRRIGLCEYIRYEAGRVRGMFFAPRLKRNLSTKTR
ncbi:hypothetical protein AGMMS49957_12880 [Synergistales bacterium]|nr:hypothetical protein AGMMS49957_12880 [Synergistales bacterium]